MKKVGNHSTRGRKGRSLDTTYIHHLQYSVQLPQIFQYESQSFLSDFSYTSTVAVPLYTTLSLPLNPIGHTLSGTALPVLPYVLWRYVTLYALTQYFLGTDLGSFRHYTGSRVHIIPYS